MRPIARIGSVRTSRPDRYRGRRERDAVQRWSDMDESARRELVARGLDDIFDPGTARLDRHVDRRRPRARRRRRVRRARRASTASTSSPTASGSPTTRSTPRAVSDDVDAAIDDAIAHLRAFNEQQLARFADWSFESEPGLVVGEKITPIASAGLFTPSGKASYPSVTYQLGRAGGRRRCPPDRRGRAPGAGRRRRGRPGRARRVSQARAPRPVPRQRPGRHRRAGVRHRVDPGGPQGGRAPARRPSQSPRSRCSATAWRR